MHLPPHALRGTYRGMPRAPRAVLSARDAADIAARTRQVSKRRSAAT